jgi:HD-like signal output (HDOD) protein
MILPKFALNRIANNIEHIGTPNCIILKLIEKISMNDYDASDLARLISYDNTVSAQVLKIANSARFFRGNPVNTINDAVVVMGSSNLKSMLLAIEFIGVFHGRGASKRFDDYEFWKHSLAGAQISSYYAKHVRMDNPECFYISALIRNIGLLAIRQFMPEEFEIILNMVENEKIPFENAFQAILGETIRQVGYIICSGWQIPEMIIGAMNDRGDACCQTCLSVTQKKAMTFADDLLHITQFALWNRYYMPENVDFSNIPCEIIFKESTEMVNSIFTEFHR